MSTVQRDEYALDIVRQLTYSHDNGIIITDQVLRTRKQSGVRQILKVCKERTRVSAVNTRSQNSVRNKGFNQYWKSAI